jgi:UDP-glucose 4-epimerase
MRIVVTGGAGFIGSHVAEAFVEKGHEVLVIDDLSRGKKENVPKGATLVAADIRSEDAARAVAEFRPDGVHHHAAQMDVRASVADPIFDAEVNVLGTAKIAKAALEAGAKVFVFASTGGAIYGEQEYFPADEAHPIRSDSPYGISKRCAEIYLDYFARKRGLRAVCLRYANVYGPRQDPHGEAGVVAIFSQKMLRGESPTIYGDGGQTRDYVYVGDVVRANLSAFENEAAIGAINIGTGVETDVNTLAKHIADAAGFRGEIRYDAARPGEQRRSVLESGRARATLGWKPEVDLATGLGHTVDWFRTKR